MKFEIIFSTIISNEEFSYYILIITRLIIIYWNRYCLRRSLVLLRETISQELQFISEFVAPTAN